MTKPTPTPRPTKRQSRKPPVSLAWLKFLYRNARDPSILWQSQVAHIYANRWLKREATSTDQTKLLISENESKKDLAFSRSSTTADEFIKGLPAIERRLQLDTLVRLVTTFETYLFDVIRRAVYVDPGLLAESKLQFTAADIVASRSTGTDIRDWLGRSVADKWIRGGDHEEKINKVDTLLKAGVSKSMSAEIDQWSKWALVRNSITHLDGDASDELATKWPSRFGRSAAPIFLSDDEIIQVATLSRKIAAAIDSRFTSNLIRHHDAGLLATECFMRWGIESPGTLSLVASQILAVRFKREEAEPLLARLKRSSSDRPASHEHGFTFSMELLRAIEKKIAAMQTTT